MRRRRAYGFALSFQDMLMAMIAVYAFLFLVAYALIKPGTYVANVHVYRVNADSSQWHSEPKLPFPVKVSLMKLNPHVEELAATEVVLSHLGEQRTALKFRIAETGGVTVDRDADVPF